MQCFYCGKIISTTKTGSTRQHYITLPGDIERSICPGSSPGRGGGNSKLNARLETSLRPTILITTNQLPTPTNDTNVSINENRFQLTMIVQNVRSIKAYKSNYRKQDPFGLEGWYEFTSHLKGHRGGIDIACIVETKCKGTLIKWDCRETGYRIYMSNKPDEGRRINPLTKQVHSYGVAIALKHKWSEHVTIVDAVSDRLMALCCIISGNRLCIISAYAPTSAATALQSHRFYLALTTLISKYVHQQYTPIILGDLNAQIGGLATDNNFQIPGQTWEIQDILGPYIIIIIII